jgi:folate-binding protein YgfZ
MGPLDAPHEEQDALAQGRAFADLSAYRKTRVTGGDARGWLNDLVTCDVASLEPGMARRSLLLTPTGHIRADFTVAADERGFVLLQAPDQPNAIDDLLARYVLSSDLALVDVTEELDLMSVLGAVPDAGLTPSVLGTGHDLLVSGGAAARQLRGGLQARGLAEVGLDAIEVWRIRRGDPRMGADFDDRAMPAEVGLDFTIDTAKGCFLGQESIARVRNLGHPPRVLRHLRADAPVSRGTRIQAGTEEAGVVSSAATDVAGGTVVLSMVPWRLREADLVTSDGIPLAAVGSMD